MTDIRCSSCGEVKPSSEFSRNRTTKTGKSSSCKACASEYYRRWKKNNREKYLAYNRRWAREETRRLRKAIFLALGQESCQHCEYDEDERVLQIDHVGRANGGGRAEQRAAGNNGIGYYKRILARIQSGHASDYQVLCANCNLIAYYDLLGVPSQSKTTSRK